MTNQLIKILKRKKIEFSRDTPVAPFTTFKIGGQVTALIKVRSTKEMRALLPIFFQEQIPYVILGGGSNIVFSENNEPFAVILDQCQEIRILPDLELCLDSGVKITRLLKTGIENEVGGFEFLAGIPGTIGGAVAVNAGAFGHYIAEYVSGAEIFDSRGNFRTVPPEFFEFAYRHSRIKLGTEVILKIYLKGKKLGRLAIQSEIREHIRYRMQHHPPFQVHSAGCFFQNPVVGDRKISAGKLIEDAGLKGLKLGDLEISPRHANFILNQGQATLEDLQRIEDLIREKVGEKMPVQLAREVIYVSPNGIKK